MGGASRKITLKEETAEVQGGKIWFFEESAPTWGKKGKKRKRGIKGRLLLLLKAIGVGDDNKVSGYKGGIWGSGRLNVGLVNRGLKLRSSGGLFGWGKVT